MTDKKSPTITTIMATATGASVQASPKKATAPGSAKSKKPRAKPTHPRTAEMVNAAIKALKERGGSSLQAIKKYITSTYKIDAEKQAPFIKKYLKAAVTNGSLVQTKGKGAAGSFKLAVGKTEVSKIKKIPSSPRSAPLKKAASPTVKKSTVTKRSVKKVAVKKVGVTKAPAATEKRKAGVKGPAAKPPKVKSAAKVKAKVPKSTPKKAAPLKKAPVKAKAKKPTKKVAAKKK